MNSTKKLLLKRWDSELAFFDQVYLFGSATQTEAPGDLDVLLIYGDGHDLPIVAAATQLVLGTLSATFNGPRIDLTVLSQSELRQTKFLEQVPHELIA